ncbi:sel1 repeat family protein [Aurantimonas sp. MSK8Z-1]|uniref:tetratricopeptide repeat protein n=1 Tax=Mangrovibrevibacter kandeliae TaxID=2968473 RepID=UPI00211998B6|nr:tetratricopeptide repeat protein [Aurantimonas sp. MSK8Z-1]MCW4116444.1 sel1 repeat family protein [Aurantimonas sp. MSK8Z-1]
MGSFVGRISVWVLLAAITGVAAAPGAKAASPGEGAPILLAAASDPCADARSHFEIAHELGTREALQLHIDAYPNCPFAPLAKMLIDKLPPEPAPAPGPSTAVEAAPPAVVPPPPATDAARAAADDLLKRLADAMRVPAGAVSFDYGDASLTGDALTIRALKAEGNRDQGYTDRVLVETVTVAGLQEGDGGAVAADRMTLSGVSTEHYDGATQAWVPYRSAEEYGGMTRDSDRPQLLVDTLTLDHPRFAGAAPDPDLVGGLVGLQGLSAGTMKVQFAGKDAVTLSDVALTAGPMAGGVPTNLSIAFRLAVDGAMISDQNFDFAKLGYPTVALGVSVALSSDPQSRTLGLDRLFLTLDDGFRLFGEAQLGSIDPATLAPALAAGDPQAQTALLGATLGRATLSFTDTGFSGKALRFIAASLNTDPGTLPALAGLGTQSWLLGTFGNAPFAADASMAVQALLQKAGGSVAAEFKPSTPVPVADIVQAAGGPVELAALLGRNGTTVTINGKVLDLAALAMAPAAPSSAPAAPTAPSAAPPALAAQLDPASQAAVDTCDALASDPDDPLQPAGVAGERNPAQVDFAKAVPACEAAHAALPNDARLAFQLGRSYFAAGRPEDATRLYKTAADAGEPLATYEYAGALYSGSGVPVDKRGAAAAYDGITDAVPLARDQLAEMLFYGDGVPADQARAMALWTAGAEAGDPLAQYNLAVQYVLGTAVPADPHKAEENFLKASQQGDADAMAELGKLYFRGIDGTSDLPKAYRFLSQAADAGSTAGLANQGMMLALGLGAPQKDEKAGADKMMAALARQDPDASAYLIEEKADRFGAATRREAQHLLRDAKLYKGPANGIFNDRTLAALRSYAEQGAQ